MINLLTIKLAFLFVSHFEGLSWSWLYDSWIYNYLYNRWLSPLKLWVRTWFLARCTQYNIMWYWILSVTWLVTGRWFSPGILVSSINKIDCHDKTEILLKVVLNAINLTSHFHIFSIWGLWRWGIVSYFTIIEYRIKI